MHSKPIRAFVRIWRSRIGRLLRKPARWAFPPEPALRAELFSADQMERHGIHLARRHDSHASKAKNLLLKRLADNESVLVKSCRMLTLVAQSNQRITPAAEWLLDNYYLIEEQIRTAQKHLPKSYNETLPWLKGGASNGLPRVYDIALEIISHGDGRVDSEGLNRFVVAYQSVMPLTLGELWAIPIMLRLTLIENLRRIAVRVVKNWNERKLAIEWADRLTRTAERDLKSVVLTVAAMAQSDPPMVGSFVAELTRRLQGQSTALAMPLTWIEQNLSESGLNIEQLVQLEAQQQAAMQVSVSNSIGSLRLLDNMDWRAFVETTSIVEQVLREDPAGVYPLMDFATRDLYRHTVERMARTCRQPEASVANAALELAGRDAAAAAKGAVQTHVGYYLLDKGLPLLQHRIGMRWSLHRIWKCALDRAPLPLYLGAITVLTGALSVPFVDTLHTDGWPGYLLALLIVATLLMTSRLAVALANWLVTLTTIPAMLPRLDYSHGIPADARTLVVVPTLVGSEQDIQEQVEGLEIRFLANRDPHLHFGLLTDFMDAPTRVLPGDSTLLTTAHRLIDELNRTYPGGDGDRFFLFHRPRRWNPADRIWMGYERKRGKLCDLNALLLGKGRDQFSLIVGDTALLTRIRYVITLDADTQLPRETAHQFVGTMEHPLNRAVYDPVKRRVVSGYAILQPRVGISLQSTARSTYAQLFGSDAGVDPYTRATSDIYQDLFGQGSFVGKGIYAVKPFEQAMEGRFPDNRILSHDLIEGTYARSGLLSDVQLYEEYPARYSTYVSRQHRWIRGDWQLLPWIAPWVRSANGRIVRNRLSALSRWKLFDNLRRSLEPAALLVILLLGWLVVQKMQSWVIAVLALVFIVPLFSSLLELVQKPHGVGLGQHLSVALRESGRHLLRAVLTLVWLPHEAWYSMDAIARTLWRILFSHRRLLQWNTSRDVERSSTRSLSGMFRLMWVGPVLGGVMFALLWSRPMSLAWAAPLLVAWLVSPVVAWWISRSPARATFRPSVADTRLLRVLARRTWAFFDRHVCEQDHWLPPDNLQQQPEPTIAHRTSPTNMGMALLAHLAAHDLGYLSTARLLQRIDGTLATMQNLPRHRGHFYNWYDTQTLKPLAPRYVSTVDSGNLAGHLLTLRAGLIELPDQPVFDGRVLEGLATTIDVVRETLGTTSPMLPALASLQSELNMVSRAPPLSLWAAAALLEPLLERVERFADHVDAIAESETHYWLQALQAQCRDVAADARFWARLPGRSFDAALRGVAAGPVPTWRDMAEMRIADAPESDREALLTCRRKAEVCVQRCAHLATVAGALTEMDFGFLYDSQRRLLSIGYNLDERRLDAGYYDLLASEVRLTHFVAIAQGQLPQEAWFSLGRLLTTTGGMPVLLSWSGSLFEYLMPMLVMPSYADTLLDQTCRTAVARQIEYGRQLSLPWGMSESGYNAMDVRFNYQYRAFGVPGLGLKRGLGEDIVVAPYATALALMVAPARAVKNLQRLIADGFSGRYGLFEAIDYTPSRLPQGQSHAVVQSFMTHHQGMSLLALVSVLLDEPMQRRFASDRQCQASMLLLQERVPRVAAEYLHAAGMPSAAAISRNDETKLLVFTDPDSPRPAVQLLSNGHYHVMVTSAGGGYSRCRELAVTRWQEDSTCDNWGMFCYLRDVESGAFWSTAHQPTLNPTDHYEAIFSDARAEFRVRQHGIDAHTEIVVSPEDDIELRRMHLTNRSRERRTIEFTSYAEVVLAPALDDAMHPAFSKLFVQTELIEPLQAIICTRRPRSSDEDAPWMCHLLAVHDAHAHAVSYETDRARFIGRGRDLIHPLAMDSSIGTDDRLSNSAGAVLDPIVSIRCRLVLEPGQVASIDLVTGIATNRNACLHLIEKYRDRHLADRVFGLAWTHSRVFLSQLNATLSDARLYEKMAAAIIYAHARLRAESGVLSANRRDQSGLWGQSISGDRPIVLLQIGSSAHIELVRQLVQAHAYWRQKGLAVDLVIWNEDQSVYRQHLRELIMDLIASGLGANLLDRPGGIFVRPAPQLSREDRLLTQAASRIVLSDTRGSLHDQIHRHWAEALLPRFHPEHLVDGGEAATNADTATEPASPAPVLDNPFGGFSEDGREYEIVTKAGHVTPAPWVNVLANPDFGTVISESGGAYTWSENAHEFRLTPWVNDPVTDASGEGLFLRDEESGRYWSPTPLPRRGSATYRTRHGFGYSVFEHIEDGIHSELWVYVAIDMPVKFSVLKVRNASGRHRHLSATGYVEWVLGDLRTKTAMHVVTELDPGSGAMFARNAYLLGFPQHVAFFDVDAADRSLTGDRSEFIGRNGSLRAPAAMAQHPLSGRIGAGLDPCGAIRTDFELDDGGCHEVVFRLGAAATTSTASTLAKRCRGTGTAADALETVQAHWKQLLGAVQVDTPDPSVNLLANGWLMYQVIASRFYARSGYYQSGGAFGFRDQLQDAMAMIHTDSDLVRQHVLYCAAHQFPEGDVQHWWHPPQDHGVRTHCSDDYLWLALVTSRYVRITGDSSILDAKASYIEGRALHAGEESYYDLPGYSSLRETLYQHCVRAIEHSMPRGVHGLPLIGTGDWNDGMNRVGKGAKGESVWLAFFLYEVLTKFADTARVHGDEVFARRCEVEAHALQQPLERHGWDGDWYRRAYFDDGSPLGSARNDACRIDSISQSWSVLSAAVSEDRQRKAMQSLDEHLVRRDLQLVQLLDPPFDDDSLLDPGYIKGYAPGVRENGGQYTHAAIWAAMAFAALGDSGRAWDVLDIINPIHRGMNAASIGVYKVEPYVVAADVYAVPPHAGRGGWSWYTGSAGWMYRLITESLLGLRVEGNRLHFVPVVPSTWRRFVVHYRFRHTLYHITVQIVAHTPPHPPVLDGIAQDSDAVALIDDGLEHHITMQYLNRPGVAREKDRV
ncbi:GH36-type glycosyl hydrolase domain-containing protein [Oleiagrimonas soli]|uniref:Cellobiose phosphorylase n=1 Tax=Oleiagrimonas soli TaxID=1543381 RepID=A0A099CT33_9GAMM|nr:glucoamylase family protein [Oleiagrimonas soli]KGI76792.1 NdvB [Oleiagrimonas soli]MBB6184964.1 cellobiose phosphorylase [Oleiagrimonas soli]